MYVMKQLFHIPFKESRNFGLDLFRTIAILFAVVYHGNYCLDGKIIGFINLFIFDGVSMFFILSGFLIGNIIFKEFEHNGMRLKPIIHFWVQRWYRTLPNYFLILLVLIGLNTYLAQPLWEGDLWRFFTFTQNLDYFKTDFFPESWSIATEEWFYFCAPLLLMLFSKIGNFKSSFLTLTLLFIFGIFVLRAYEFTQVVDLMDGKYFDLHFRKSVILRADSVMYGFLGAYIFHYNRKIWDQIRIKGFWIGLSFVIVNKVISKFTGNNNWYSGVFTLSLIPLAFTLMLPYFYNLKIKSQKIMEVVQKISLISYSLYLTNLSLIYLPFLHNKVFIDHSIANQILKISIYYISVFGLSILIYKYFEAPILKFRDRNKYS